jgi:succinyl-CoA synthetase beta subunit
MGEQIVLCLDAKLNFDSNAQFRHEEIFKMHDPTEDDPREIKAREFDLNYIPLNGNVGCLGEKSQQLFGIKLQSRMTNP